MPAEFGVKSPSSSSTMTRTEHAVRTSRGRGRLGGAPRVDANNLEEVVGAVREDEAGGGHAALAVDDAVELLFLGRGFGRPRRARRGARARGARLEGRRAPEKRISPDLVWERTTRVDAPVAVAVAVSVSVTVVVDTARTRRVARGRSADARLTRVADAAAVEIARRAESACIVTRARGSRRGRERTPRRGSRRVRGGRWTDEGRGDAREDSVAWRARGRVATSSKKRLPVGNPRDPVVRDEDPRNDSRTAVYFRPTMHRCVITHARQLGSYRTGREESMRKRRAREIFLTSGSVSPPRLLASDAYRRPARRRRVTFPRTRVSPPPSPRVPTRDTSR